MAGAIEGLTILINGDATPFKRAMREAKAEGTMLARHLATVNKLIQFDPGSLTLLTRRQQLLNAALAQNAAHLNTLRTAHEAYASRAATLTEAERRQWMKVQSRISEVELQYAQLRAQAIQYGAAASAANMKVIANSRGLQASLAKVSNSLLMISATVAVIGGLSLKAAVEFESSFAGVRKTIIATEYEYEQLARAARDLALVKPVNVNDINYIMELGGQLNIAKRYLVDFASVMADLSVSTNMGLEDGSLNLARFMNIVNMSQADVDRLGATIVDLGNNSATTEADIMLMAMRIAGSASNIGLSAQNVLALATALSSVGIQAEMGGNAISTIMNRIDKAVALDQNTLSTWAQTAGMTTEEFKYNWQNNVQDTLIAIIKGMGRYREEGNNLNVLLKDMNIGYMRQIDTMQRLSRAGQLTEELFIRSNTAWANNTALVREATQRYSTAESKMKMMGNALYETGIAIGNEILPSFTDLVVGITDLVKGFASMDEGTKAFLIDFGAIALTAPLVIKAVEKVAGGIGFLAEKYAQLKTWVELSMVAEQGYTEMQIAEAAATQANIAAATAEASAQARSASIKAASLRRSAEHAAALGAEAYAAKLVEAAARQEAIANAANTVVIESNSAAAVANAGQKGLLSSITKMLTADTWALSAALGVTNLQLLAFAGAAAVIVLLGAAIFKAIDPMNQLTKATQKQKAELDSATERYNRLREELGDSADETVKAKAAMEDLEIAYRDSYETIGQFNQRMSDTVKATRELREETEKATQEAYTEAGQILNTAEAIQRLKYVQTDTGKLELAGYVANLNSQVDGLDLTMVDAIENTEKFQYAMDQAQQEADRVRYENAYEQFGNLSSYAASLNESLEEMRQQYSWLNDEVAREMIENPTADAGADTSGMVTAGLYYNQMKELEAVNADLEEQKRTLKETADESDAYELAMRYAQDANVDLADALKFVSREFGINATEQGLSEYRTKKQTEALAKQTQELDEYRNDLVEMTEQFPILNDMLANAGMTFDGLAQYLNDAGIKAKDFEKRLEDVTKAAQNMYDALEENPDVSLDSVIDTLINNRDYMNRFADNMHFLHDYAAQAGRDDWEAFLDGLSAASEDDAALVAALAASPERFAEVYDAYYESGMAAMNATAEGIGMGGETAMATQAEVSAKLVGIVNKGADDYDKGTGKIVKSIREVIPKVKSAYTEMEHNASGAVGRMVGSILSLDMSKDSYRWGVETIANYVAGIKSQEPHAGAAATLIANGVTKILGHSIAEAGPMHNGGRGEVAWGEHLVDNLIRGMRNREEALSDEAQSLAETVTGPLSGMSANWDASFNATRSLSNRTILAAQGAGGQVYNVYMDGVRINDDAAVQDAVMTLIGAAQVSAQARRQG